MNEQNLNENTKNKVKDTAVPATSNNSQEIKNDSPPKFKDDTGSKGDTDPQPGTKDDPQPGTKDDPQPGTKDNPKSDTQNNSVGTSLADSSFLDLLYNKIDGAIGGENPNQFLCLTIPGQALTAEDFAFDYKSNAEKSLVVAANESKLANKLFDPCRITGSDNGMSLVYQYRSALNTLTPKLNAKIAEAKNQLRELLLSSYEYDFGDGNAKEYTLQEVFYRLYDEYISAEEAWANKQNKKKEELRKQYAENNAYNNAYLEWYETVSKSELAALNEKRAKVLSVFAPGDMDILNGVLDSGAGSELEQARMILENIQRQTPDGGIVFPVKFNPTNWFEYLDTSFIPSDLLESPAALSMKLHNFSNRRIALTARINELSEMLPNKDSLKKIQEEVKTARDSVNSDQNELIGKYGEGAIAVFNTAIDIASLFPENKIPQAIINKLTAGFKKPDDDKDFKKFFETAKNTFESQQKYINSSQKLADTLAEAEELKAMDFLRNQLSPIQEQLTKVNAEIDELKLKIKLSNAADASEKGDEIMKVTPPTVPAGFTQILIEASSSSMNKNTTKKSSASNRSNGISLWFAGFSEKKEVSNSFFEDLSQEQDSTIRIGMNVAKVGIEREWFNPGLFALTKDMFNVSTVRISPDISYDSITDGRLEEMGKGYILPCYPVSMIIARDISIQFTSSSQKFSSFAKASEEHASHGGGFLIFTGAKSSTTMSSSSGATANSTENSITIRFSTPQIIGYYIETTLPDKSSVINDISNTEEAVGFVTVSQFVNDYKELLLNQKQKNNTEQQN